MAHFVISNIEKKYPDLREWLQTHYLSLNVDSKDFLGGAKTHPERLQLQEKRLVHFNTVFCQETTDMRVKESWQYMECHARMCLNAITWNDERKLVDDVSKVELRKCCDASDSSVLSVFVYDAQPTGTVICPDHVDRGFITCTTNQDGGLEVFIDDH